MEPGSIYKSDASRAAIEALYDRALARLPFPTECRRVESTFGNTHVLVAGPEGAPPLVALQGGNVVNPLTLAWLTSLAGDFRINARAPTSPSIYESGGGQSGAVSWAMISRASVVPEISVR